MITVKDAVRTVVGYNNIQIKDEYGALLFKGSRWQLTPSDFKEYFVSGIDRERSTLCLVVDRQSEGGNENVQ